MVKWKGKKEPVSRYFTQRKRCFGSQNVARSLKVSVKAVSGVCSTFGVQNLNPQQEKAVAEFLSGSDVFVNLPTGYGKPLRYHIAPLVSGD